MVKSKWLLAVAGIALALSISACGGNNDDKDTTDGNGTTTNTPSENNGTQEGTGTVDAAAAETVYQSNCVSCHATDLAGGVGPNLQKVGSRLSADEISARIHDGGGGMPAFKGQLSDADIANLAGWLKTKQ